MKHKRICDLRFPIGDWNNVVRFIMVFAGCAYTAFSQETAPYPVPPKDISSSVTLVGPKEPGERLVLTGTVYKADGKTPYGGMVFFLYQTDADGVYNKTDGSYRSPRLCGWVKTDATGQYEIRTIKPGTYPRGGTPAHIHVTMKPENGVPVWLDSFLFEGDPYLTADDRNRDEKGKFSCIVTATKDKSGVSRAQRDFRVRN